MFLVRDVFQRKFGKARGGVSGPNGATGARRWDRGAR